MIESLVSGANEISVDSFIIILEGTENEQRSWLKSERAIEDGTFPLKKQRKNTRKISPLMKMRKGILQHCGLFSLIKWELTGASRIYSLGLVICAHSFVITLNINSIADQWSKPTVSRKLCNTIPSSDLLFFQSN